MVAHQHLRFRHGLCLLRQLPGRGSELDRGRRECHHAVGALAVVLVQEDRKAKSRTDFLRIVNAPMDVARSRRRSVALRAGRCPCPLARRCAGAYGCRDGSGNGYVHPTLPRANSRQLSRMRRERSISLPTGNRLSRLSPHRSTRPRSRLSSSCRRKSHRRWREASP